MRTAGVEPAQPCGRGILSQGQAIDLYNSCYGEGDFKMLKVSLKAGRRIQLGRVALKSFPSKRVRKNYRRIEAQKQPFSELLVVSQFEN